MSKNFYDLLVGIITGIEVIADAVFVFLGVTGKIDQKVATAWAGSVTIIGGAILGVCARFIDDTKKLKK